MSSHRYSVIIAEDEPLTRDRIVNLLVKLTNFEIIAAVSNGVEAVNAIRIHKPDIIFLDIKMPLLDGFDVLKEIRIEDYKLLVFITAYDQYAVRAFDREALDYLLKPFDQKRFMKLIARIEKYFNNINPRDDEVLVIKEKGEVFRLNTSEIIFVKAENNYVNIYLEEKCFKKRIPIFKILEMLNSNFLRVHRSFLINKKKIVKMKHVKGGDYLIKMSNGKSIISSKNYRDSIKSLVK